MAGEDVTSPAGPRVVRSNQTGPHRDLRRVVERHLESEWRRPIAGHTRAAFEDAAAWLSARPGRPLVLDSCCGTGESTRALAVLHPDASIIGIDKSAARLARHAAGAETNYRLLRADANDFWRLAASAGWVLAQHYLLYPNPWPKAAQLRKRWHASPALGGLLALGGMLHVRTNWRIYAEEFVIALGVAGVEARISTPGEAPTTAFERKYGNAGQTLFEVTADLNEATRRLASPPRR